MGQVLNQPTPSILETAKDAEQFTRTELAITLGELQKLGLIRVDQDGQYKCGEECSCVVTRYSLTEKRP